MSDPFRSSNEKQLYREAQYGLAVITCLVALFVYMAVNRIRHVDEIPQVVLDAPMTRLASPRPKANANVLEIKSDLTAGPSVKNLATPAMQEPARFDNAIVRANHLESAESESSPLPSRRTYDGGTTTANRSQTLAPSLESSPAIEEVKKQRSKQLATAAEELKNLLVDLKSRRNGLEKSLAEVAPERADSFMPTSDQNADEGRSSTTPTELVASRIPAAEENRFQPNPDLQTFDPTTPPDLAESKTQQPLLSGSQEREKNLPEQSFLPLPNHQSSAATTSPSNDNGFSFQPISPGSQHPNPAPEKIAPVDSGPQALVPSLRPSRPMPDEPVSVVADFGTTQPTVRSSMKGDEEIRAIVTEGPETYYSLAQKHYDDGRFFRALHRYNQDRIQIEKLGLAWGEERNGGTLASGVTIAIPSESLLRTLYPTDCPKKDDLGILKNGRSGLVTNASERLYETREGDTLLDIARDQLGQASRYLEILEMNRNWLDDVAASTEGGEIFDLTRLPAGIRLVLPPKSIQ